MEMIEIKQGFWNIRGAFKLGGVVDIGTQASLVRLQDGNFVLLDACSLSAEVLAKIDQLTDGGKRLKAILHVHPFHTVFATKLHERFPDAALYGTSRHQALLPALPWQAACTESAELHALFAEDFEFSVPQGVDFISSNEQVHFSSVLVFHPASKTIHVDDTLMFAKLPGLLGRLGLKNVLSFHPSLALALHKYPGAADEFEQWVRQLSERWASAENLCAAHMAPLLGQDDKVIQHRIIKALGNVKWILAAHRLRCA